MFQRILSSSNEIITDVHIFSKVSNSMQKDGMGHAILSSLYMVYPAVGVLFYSFLFTYIFFLYDRFSNGKFQEDGNYVLKIIFCTDSE